MGEEIECSENQRQILPEEISNNDLTQKKSNIPDSKEDDDEQVLKFMDALDSYLSLIHSLSSTLRQGWFDLASARYSMGASRVNSVLLDLKEHSAATYLEVATNEDPHFTLCKWASVNSEDSTESKDGDSGLKHNSSIRQRHKDTSDRAGEEDSSPSEASIHNTVDRVQRERAKPLAVFGTFVSPKLRSAQSSFETALERLVEIANAKASMLSSFDKVRGNRVDADDVKT
ncbi:uncharacterized protein LOC141611827 [Silene latifolia]|uniref:uncharacterized protein LOC141611827 n=1 Tax=Silene latifolia TaxID=37657 RepID=UPI003D78804B